MEHVNAIAVSSIQVKFYFSYVEVIQVNFGECMCHRCYIDDAIWSTLLQNFQKKMSKVEMTNMVGSFCLGWLQ